MFYQITKLKVHLKVSVNLLKLSLHEFIVYNYILANINFIRSRDINRN